MSQTPEQLQFLRHYKHIAVVGLSSNPARPSYSVSQYMQAAGYIIIPINPRYVGTTILGKHVYASLTEAREAGEEIEIVDVFRRSEDTPPVAAEAVQVGARVVWLQLGITNREARERVTQAGIVFVEDKCIKVEYAHLFAQA